MTCIVGFVDKENKITYIGADSAASGGSNITTRKDPKIFKKGEFIFGCTSSYRMIQLLRFSLIIPSIDNKDVYEYMCTDFIDSVRSCFKDGGYMQKDTYGDEMGGIFIVGYKDRLFKIESSFQVAESLDGIDATGCGQDFALGSIYSTRDNNDSPKDKIIKALEVSEFLTMGVRGPFIVLNT